jgi:hypothetical protein
MSEWERYDIRNVEHHLDRIIECRKSGDLDGAIYELALAVATISDCLRAKERGDAPRWR